jgi:hypothetical protein
MPLTLDDSLIVEDIEILIQSLLKVKPAPCFLAVENRTGADMKRKLLCPASAYLPGRWGAQPAFLGYNSPVHGRHVE